MNLPMMCHTFRKQFIKENVLIDSKKTNEKKEVIEKANNEVHSDLYVLR